MKILTLNTHSLVEENYLQKLEIFIKAIKEELPDVIALQEVNQSADAPAADEKEADGWVPVENTGILLRQDNHALKIAGLLKKAGIFCSWTWLPVKLGYGKYDEGMAFFSLNSRIIATDSFYISLGHDYRNWKTRMALGIKTEKDNSWFYTTHMGWWNDEEEPFSIQLKVLNDILYQKRNDGPVWLMGDFNSPDTVRNQGYDALQNTGWKDTYLLAEQKDSGITVGTVIDGWRDQIDDADSMEGMRIDYIWCSHNIPIACSNVIFNGKNGSVVSDHFGIIVETAHMTDTENRDTEY
ncbi:MAG: endonuclease/exonuclease/phosphatase family protein [Lachnospiraceae bacterium]|nr:endonuclease/exonuclease/phosphatase family protein [Lachnospiraceae bacterium]